MGKTALIIGASGLVGNELLKQLLADSSFEKIKIFVRKRIPTEDSKLEQIIINFDYISSYYDLIKGDVLFCCMGTTIKTAGSKDAFIKVDYTYPMEFAKIAKQNGVKKMLLISSIGADKTASNFYLKVKGDIEESLGKLNFESLIILRPSMLLGSRKEFRFGESAGKIFMKLFTFTFIGKLKKYRAIEVSAAAKAMTELSKIELKGVNIFLSDDLQKIGGK